MEPPQQVERGFSADDYIVNDNYKSQVRGEFWHPIARVHLFLHIDEALGANHIYGRIWQDCRV